MAFPTTQTSHFYGASGQQMSPPTMDFQYSSANPSTATAGYSQPPQPRLPLGNSTDRAFNDGDGYYQYTSAN